MEGFFLIINNTFKKYWFIIINLSQIELQIQRQFKVNRPITVNTKSMNPLIIITHPINHGQVFPKKAGGSHKQHIKNKGTEQLYNLKTKSRHSHLIQRLPIMFFTQRRCLATSVKMIK